MFYDSDENYLEIQNWCVSLILLDHHTNSPHPYYIVIEKKPYFQPPGSLSLCCTVPTYLDTFTYTNIKKSIKILFFIKNQFWYGFNKRETTIQIRINILTFQGGIIQVLPLNLIVLVIKFQNSNILNIDIHMTIMFKNPRSTFCIYSRLILLKLEQKIQRYKKELSKHFTQ